MKKALSMTKLLIISSGGLLISPLLNAQTDSVEETQDNDIGSITVYGTTNKEAAIEDKKRKQLNLEMVNDNKELLRYSTDVGLSDSGRIQKGFAMRGVEGNRVHISFDGIEIPNSEENSLYARYGNFNSSRIQLDPELARSIEFVKSSDSFNAGSGSLGGSVNYRSLRISDVLFKKDKFGGMFRSGYSNKNQEWFTTLGLGYRNDKFDIFALASQRKGEQTKSHGSGSFIQGSKSQHPDPSHHEHKNFLVALNYHINSQHHLGFKLSRQNIDNFTNERSYALLPSWWRNAQDVSRLETANVYYEYTPLTSIISSIKAQYDYQKTDLGAISHKGSSDWKTGKPVLDDIFDRRYATEFNRLLLSAEFTPIESEKLGEHTISLQSSISYRDFKSLNKDTIGVSLSSGPETYTTTIQYPTRTKQHSLSLMLDSYYNSVFSSKVGLRYDHTKIKTKNLNATCSRACLAEGRPSPNSFNNYSGSLNLDAQINDTWKIGYRISSGYRVPTASELYFSFENVYGTWQSNRDLKPEKSLNHTLSLQADNNIGNLTLNTYHNRYSNFLFENTTLIEKTKYGRTWQTPVNQMVNIDSAKVYGVDLAGKLFLDQISPMPQGFEFIASLGYSKGKLSNKASLLSIQPLKAIIGLDYIDPNDRFGIMSRLTYLGGKKGKDAQVDEVKSRCIKEEFDYWSGGSYCAKTELYKEIEEYKYLNKSAYVFDLMAYFKPIERITLTAGIFNLFNHKYQTWDALRGISAVSTTNSVDRKGLGLQRFYATGRNYSISFEYKF